MNLKNKEKYLLSQGRKQETIDFVKSCKVPKDDFVWFVTRIEKDNIDLDSTDLDELKENISKTLKLFNRYNEFRNLNSINQAFRIANQIYESDSDIESRKLHKFKDGHYILNLSYKELPLEGKFMANCVSDYSGSVKNKETCILAIKNKKNKTICHFQIGKHGDLIQYYSKANSTVKFDVWGYINDFFKAHEDKEIKKLLKDRNVPILYSYAKMEGQPPTFSMEMPIKKDLNLITGQESYSNVIELKKFNLNMLSNDLLKFKHKSNVSNQEVIDFLDEYENTLLESLREMRNVIKKSEGNIFVLNNDIIEKCFNKTIAINDKFISLFQQEGMISKSLNSERYEVKGCVEDVEMYSGDDVAKAKDYLDNFDIDNFKKKLSEYDEKQSMLTEAKQEELPDEKFCNENYIEECAPSPMPLPIQEELINLKG